MALRATSKTARFALYPQDIFRRLRIVAANLQRDLRSSDLAQIVACAAIGTFVGAVVDLLRGAVEWLHRFDFALRKHELLSEGHAVDRAHILLVPAIGGLLLGALALLARRWRNHDIVDPVEANALYGGRMSLVGQHPPRASPRSSPTLRAHRSAWKRDIASLGAGIFSTMRRLFRSAPRRHARVRDGGRGRRHRRRVQCAVGGCVLRFRADPRRNIRVRALAPVAVAAVAATLDAARAFASTCRCSA